MPPILRRVLVLAVAATLAPWAAAGAQTACGQLFPIGVTPPEGGFEAGCVNQYTFRYPATTASFVPLALPPCDSGPCTGLTPPNQFACEMTNGYSCCISISQSLQVVAGNYSGPVVVGLDNRFAKDTDQRGGICFSDYAGNGARIGIVILIEPVLAGASETQVTGFLRVFVSDYAKVATASIRIEVLDATTRVQFPSWGRIKALYR